MPEIKNSEIENQNSAEIAQKRNLSLKLDIPGIIEFVKTTCPELVHLQLNLKVLKICVEELVRILSEHNLSIDRDDCIFFIDRMVSEGFVPPHWKDRFCYFVDLFLWQSQVIYEESEMHEPSFDMFKSISESLLYNDPPETVTQRISKIIKRIRTSLEQKGDVDFVPIASNWIDFLEQNTEELNQMYFEKFKDPMFFVNFSIEFLPKLYLRNFLNNDDSFHVTHDAIQEYSALFRPLIMLHMNFINLFMQRNSPYGDIINIDCLLEQFACWVLFDCKC